MAYKRVLLKISGEQLAGKYEFGVDPDMASFLAEEIKKAIVDGCELVLVVGGGNMVRGAEIAGHGIRRVTGDQMGMLSGLINSMALTDIFEAHGLPTRCLSNVYAEQIAESYSYRLAEKHLQNHRVVIVAGGSGRSYVTHDTAAVMFALELDCEVVLKATKADAVYDRDPAKFSDATKVGKMTFDESLTNVDITVMDKAALGLALEQKKPIIVFNPMTKNHIARVIAGDSIGTRIS